MIIFVGLGNPDIKYAKTYHNIGFMVVDELAKRLNIPFTKHKGDAKVGEGEYMGEKILIAKPQTYMNFSGISIERLKKKNKEARLIVICDDIDLPPGKLRFREKGGPGTHNGLRNIVLHMGENFMRLRVGIGSPDGNLAEFITSKISDIILFNKIIGEAVELLISKIK